MMRLNRVVVRRLLVAASLTGLGWPSMVAAQPTEGAGLVPTALLLRQMEGVKRVLMIGAHPDDEDTGLLTALARGRGAETAYLALTRGDGGQNLIGPELWEGLGIIRTGELEAARALDGGRQFFTRAFDYGYSKSADEALSLWPRDELLHDVVWVVRQFRPQVIVSVFSGTPSDGHGQHQAAGIMAREAFEAAGDPTRFPEQLERGLEPWTPAKLYQSSRRRFFGGGDDEALPGSVTIPTGDFDPLLGRSLFQLSMESRSQHRSQDMGAPQPAGPRTTGATLVATNVGGEDGGLFAGIDTTLAGITAGLIPAGRDLALPYLEQYRAAVARARERLGVDPSEIVPDLVEAFDLLVQARREVQPVADLEFTNAIGRKQALATRAILAASGIVFDVRASDDLVVPGQTVEVRAQLWNGSPNRLVTPGIQLISRGGWEIRFQTLDGLTGDASVAPSSLATWTYEVTVPEDAVPSRLYYLRENRDGAWYRWPPDPGLWGLPRDPASLEGAVTFRLTRGGRELGSRIVSSVPWRYVGVDPARGEFAKQVLIVPALSVDVASGSVVWPQERTEPREVSVVLLSHAPEGSRGDLVLEPPDGWAVAPSSLPFELAGPGAERTLTFTVRPDGPAAPGEHVFTAVATTVGGRTYSEGVALIDYDHIPRSPLHNDATATVTVAPIAVRSGLRVGYIMGSGDDGPEAIRQMGASVDLLDEDRVREGDFGAFDVIVLGVRAYETRADLQAASGQLLDFARAGGTVVTQYNRGPLGALAPASIRVGRGSPRVADETAAVRLMEPDAPVFTTPNRIGDEDFDGWVQERGLYFAAEWADDYVPLMELNDPDEEPHRGALLVTSVGDGVFVYTGLSFFRQWSERVPGAYRLFANLISLDGDTWRSFEGAR
jgi:LmbE family N-acetylglucosaminyl deacetylase